LKPSSWKEELKGGHSLGVLHPPWRSSRRRLKLEEEKSLHPLGELKESLASTIKTNQGKFTSRVLLSPLSKY
jgi:hypothetical protein